METVGAGVHFNSLWGAKDTHTTVARTHQASLTQSHAESQGTGF